MIKTSIQSPQPTPFELPAKKQPKVLIVGCGAVGQVFGLYLIKAGVELGFYARPASADKLKQALEHGGIPIFHTSYSHRRHPIAHRLENYQVVTDVAESQRFKPDQIWFTTPSPVYYSEWFHEFLQKVPSERVVCFAPEGGRSEFFPVSGGEDRLVFGGVTFISWQGDLEGSSGRPDGVNFWLPPLLGIPLMGEGKACREVGDLLKKAGFRIGVKKPNFHKTLASMTAVISAFVAGLELSGWSFGAFRKSPWRQRAACASREAALSQLSGTGIFTRTLLRILLSSAGFFLATFFLPLLLPFDLEKYLKFHYLKTRDQTLTLLYVFERDGKRRGLPVENITLLLQGLGDSA
jgi:ketopantoate reductase